MNRRKFISSSLAVGATVALSADAPAQNPAGNNIKIVGVSCSPRRGKTTAFAVGTALQAAAEVDPRIETELIDLGGMQLSGYMVSNPSGGTPGDFDTKVKPVLLAENLGGLIIGSPVYFRSLSALCKAFLEQLAVLRKPELLLADTPVGILSVGSYRNGGQELVIEQIQAAMLCHEVMIVGGKPGAHQGATLWNAYNDDIIQDEFGIKSAQLLGTRLAQAALKLPN